MRLSPFMEKNVQYRSRIFSVERIEYETSSGHKVAKDVVRHPGSVAILPILTDGTICLIRNRRVSVNEFLLEIPAGTMEPPEPAQACAFRELIEETGYHAANMVPMVEFFPAPGILDERMHLFVATGLRAGTAAREIGEEIENHVVSLDKALSMMHSGEIHDAKTMLALLLHQQQLTRQIEG